MVVRAENQLGRLAGWTVIAGKIDKLVDVDRERLLLIGACTAKFKEDGIFVQGCPPHNRDVCRGLRATGIDVVTGMDIDSIDAMEKLS